MLLNSDGYWLLAPDKKLEWGFMYPKKKSLSFASIYPDAWGPHHIQHFRAVHYATGKLHILHRPRHSRPADDSERTPDLETRLFFSRTALDAETGLLARNYLGLFAGLC